MRENVFHKSDAVVALNSTPINSDTTTNGATVDRYQSNTRNFNSVLFLGHTTAWTTGEFALSVEDSPDDSVWTAAAADQVSGPTAALTAANQVEEIAYHGTARYCRLVVTSTLVVTTGADVDAIAVLWDSPGSHR